MRHEDRAPGKLAVVYGLEDLVDVPERALFDERRDLDLAVEDKLQRALLSPSYTGGFEAAKKLVAQGWFEQETAVKTEMEHGGGSSALTQEQDSSPTPPLKTVAVNLNRALTELREADLFRAAGVLAGHYGGEAVSDEARTRAEDALGLFNFWFKFKLISPGLESKAIAFDSWLRC